MVDLLHFGAGALLKFLERRIQLSLEQPRTGFPVAEQVQTFNVFWPGSPMSKVHQLGYVVHQWCVTYPSCGTSAPFQFRPGNKCSILIPAAEQVLHFNSDRRMQLGCLHLAV